MSYILVGDVVTDGSAHDYRSLLLWVPTPLERMWWQVDWMRKAGRPGEAEAG